MNIIESILNRGQFKPDGCSNCPFAVTSHDVNLDDPDEGYYGCYLVKKDVWGESPACTHQQWVDKAKTELAFLSEGFNNAHSAAAYYFGELFKLKADKEPARPFEWKPWGDWFAHSNIKEFKTQVTDRIHQLMEDSAATSQGASMSVLKRYDPFGDDDEMLECDDGQWCKHADVATLTEQVRELEAELVTARMYEPQNGEPDIYVEIQGMRAISPAKVQAISRENKQLRAECERLRQAREWQPIETAPKDGTFFWGFWFRRDNGPVLPFCYGAACWRNNQWQNWEWSELREPAAWMPLPEPLQLAKEQPT